MLLRAARLITGFVLPPALGVLLVVLTMWMLEPKVELAETAEIFIVGIYFGFLTVGLQSIIYSLLMEFYVRKRVANDWMAIKISALFGALASSPLILMGLTTETANIVPFLDGVWTLIYGAFIGAVVGWGLRRIEPREHVPNPS